MTVYKEYEAFLRCSSAAPAVNRTKSLIGRRRSPGFLHGKLLDSAGNGPDDFRTVEATTRDGRKVRGIRLSEDTWSMQIRDLSGSLHSFWKQDLADVQVARKTPMPSYQGVLQEQELGDVVAYLSGLRGAN